MSYVEVITNGGRRRYWSYDEKVRMVEESLAPGESVSQVARRNGVRPNQQFLIYKEILYLAFSPITYIIALFLFALPISIVIKV